ncbi:JAB1/Mov34/MPN/PAD-1 ubiquitin protease-domain-containing protein [Zychaea mexicana]|uniref:JAB1/Mov34/MPN/PAD-1 ubiquitin protease-domain-containing protein n=1 Tax=Zychaea mexicana TaxID=64656 RepID=UPI0022FF3E35|nr:JAB1/Mov34/MPN/PAD-1 ubiquitin protease-domain-containing protein [Zychaea mexicana]KAI9499455.1 JAB1/Mov34/MPN/PAD-1 ubiquitin protease-domain-containing protein [Zychaea mexicana]
MLMKVLIPSSVYHIILSHALSTEKEEVIGMLIGEWQGLKNTNPFMSNRALASVEAVSLLTRSDKRKDRVEIAPEQLHLAALEAEQVGKRLGRKMCVIGWYHSHPHITVFPSHVDLRTQLSQQYLDSHFFGIIVSCFDSSSDHTQRVQITCFQSENAPDGTVSRVNVPIEIVPSRTVPPVMRETFLDLPKRMFEEHYKEYEAATSKRILYSDHRNVTSDKMTELYNTGVYGQSITHLVDNVICPATHILENTAQELDHKIEEVKRKLSETKKRNDNAFLIEL